MYEWAEEMNCAVTVCNTEGVILFMNKKSKETFAKYGDMIGKNMMGCHNPKSIEMIKKMLATGGSNTYTIEKEGVKIDWDEQFNLTFLHIINRFLEPIGLPTINKRLSVLNSIFSV